MAHDVNKCLCASCKSIRGEYKGKNNPMYGKKRPDLSERNREFPPQLGKIRLDLRGNNSPTKRKEVRQKISLKLRKSNHPLYGKHHSTNAKRKMSLSHGGTGIPYENNVYPEKYFKIRPKILKRDFWTCQFCNANMGIKLEVHHIDYDKQNCDEQNLITLCHNCNITVNNDRKKWRQYFEKRWQK